MEQRADSPQQDVLTLAIPPQPGYLSIARIFASITARRYGCGEDLVEDLKVAISEAVTNGINAHDREGVSEHVTVRACSEGADLWFEVLHEGAADEQVASDGATPAQGIYKGSLGLVMIQSLFPAAEMIPQERGSLIRFPVEPEGPETVTL